MAKLSRVIKSVVWQTGYWISPVLKSSLFKFTTGSTEWGTLSWTQTFPGDEKGYIKVDVLNASDDSVLVGDLVYQDIGHDLSQYSLPPSINLKIKVKFWKKTESPIVTKIGIRTKEEW